MNAPETIPPHARTRETVIGLVDAALVQIGEPTYSAIRATFSMAVADDSADPRTLGLAIAEIRRQRVAHKAVSEELALVRMALQRGDTANALALVEEAQAFADHHARRLQAALIPPEIPVLAFVREARTAREMTGGAS